MKMMALLSGLASLLITGGLSAQSMVDRCPRLPFNHWLVSQSGAGAERAVAEDRILIVRRNLDEAIEMLEDEAVIGLSAEAASTYVGEKLDIPVGSDDVYYLVRSVFSNNTPHLSVSWQGSTLHVFTGSLGCGTFEKQPLIMLLDQKPRWVSVGATSAL